MEIEPKTNEKNPYFYSNQLFHVFILFQKQFFHKFVSVDQQKMVDNPIQSFLI